LALLCSGLIAIVVSVLVVLESANGPGTGPKSFEERRSYDQVKVEVQRTFPLALLGALAGLGLAIVGTRVLESATGRSEEAES
jgi:hypothetical protein